MLHTLIAKSQAADRTKYDYAAFARHLHFNPSAQMSLGPEIAYELGERVARPLSEHATRQLFAKLGPAVFGKGSNKILPFDYLSAIPQDLLAQNLNRHLVNGNGSKYLVRCTGSGDEERGTVRAILDANYPGGADEHGDFENTQYLKVVQSFIDEQPDNYPDLKLVRPYVGADEIGIKISWRDVNPLRDDKGGSYGIGTFIGNSEIGTGKLKILPFVQRTTCENSIIYTRDSGIELIHRGSFAAIRTQFKAAIGKALHAAADVLDKFIEAEYEQIPDFDAVLSGLALQHGWSEPVKVSVAVGTEGKQTRAGIVNGVTYAAHSSSIIEPLKQIEMEMLGGELLMVPARDFEQAANFARRRAAGLN